MNLPEQELPTLTTRVSYAAGADNRFWGYSVDRELAGCTSLGGLIALGVGGRRLTVEEEAVLDEIAVASSAGDTRLWPFKAIRVIAAYGRELPAFAAAILVFQSEMIGPLLTTATARELVDLRRELGEDRLDDLTAIAATVRRWVASGRRLSGFGVPFRGADERHLTLLRRLEARGRGGLPYIRLSARLSEVMAHKRIQPNATLSIGAAMLDLGFEPDQIGVVVTCLMIHLFAGIAHEGALEQAEVLRALPTSCVDYQGPPPRRSPRLERGG